MNEEASLTFSRVREIAKDAVLIVPAAHLTVCFVYLSFYFLGFGNRIQVFAGPTDAFSLSFGNIFPFYVGFAFPQILTTYSRLQVYSGVPAQTVFEVKRYQKILAVACIGFAGLLILLGTVFWSITGLMPVNVWFSAALLGLIVAIQIGLRKHTPIKRELIYAVAVGLTFLAYSAIKEGQRDRYAPVDELQPMSSCEDKHILKALGSDYLAVDDAGTRLVLDSECKVRFQVGKPTKPFFLDFDVPEVLLRLRARLRTSLTGDL